MPFATEFDAVYEFVIKPALSEAGFKVVERADEAANQQLIMRDVIANIEKAHLIVADLTEGNPNVLYELGVAHALNRPVVLLTQDIENLPFDLASYRVIPYATQLGDAHRARDNLAKVAQGALSGDTLFSSPVSDALGSAVSLPSAIAIGSDDEELPGLLDHAEEVESRLGDLTASLGRITKHTEDLGNSMERSSGRITEADESGQQLTPREVRRFLGEVTEDLDRYVSELSAENDTYEALLGPLESSLEGLISLHLADTDEQRAQLEESLDSLSNLRKAVQDGLVGLEAMETSVSSLPPIERRFNRAQRSVVRELSRLKGLIRRTEAIAERAEELGRTRLDAA